MRAGERSVAPHCAQSPIGGTGIEHHPLVTGRGAASVEPEALGLLNTILGNLNSARHGTSQ